MGRPEQTQVVRVAGLPQAAARRFADALDEVLDPQETAVSLYEVAGGWTVAIHGRHLPDLAAVALIARRAEPDAAPVIITDTIAPRDWVAASLAGLTPVRAGRFFVHGAHHRTPPTGIAIEIEAALAFGTGHHGTTRGCLLALDRLVRQDLRRRIGPDHLPLQGRAKKRCILDVGTGTGVLAMAAAKALRRRLLASDIDRQAVSVARANVRANGVGSLITVLQAAGLAGARFRHGAPYDLVFANILLGPLQRLAAPLALLTAPGGRIVLSGLLPAQANAALAAYRAQRVYLERRLMLDGWTTLVLVAGRGRRS